MRFLSVRTKAFICVSPISWMNKMGFRLGCETLIWEKIFWTEKLAALKNESKTVLQRAENRRMSDVTGECKRNVWWI